MYDVIAMKARARHEGDVFGAEACSYKEGGRLLCDFIVTVLRPRDGVELVDGYYHACDAEGPGKEGMLLGLAFEA